MSPRKLLFLLVLLTLTITSQAATQVVFQLTDSRFGTLSSTTNRIIQVQRLSYPDSVNGAQVIIGDPFRLTTDVTGSVTFTNALAGLYACEVKAPPSATRFQILVTATNLGTIYAADCLVAASTATFPAGSVAWAASVTDNRYARTAVSQTNYATWVGVTNLINTRQPTNEILTQYSGIPTNTFVNTTTLTYNTNATYLFVRTLSTNATNYALTIGGFSTNFTVTTSNSLRSIMQGIGTTITNNFYLASNPSSYVTQSVTNGLATQAYAQSLTNTLYSLLGTTAFSNSVVFYPRSNPSNFVDATITNALNARLGTAAFQNLGTFYLSSNPEGFITSFDIADFATESYAQGLTNALWSLLGTAARSNASVFYPATNPNGYVTSTITNALNARLGSAAFVNTNLFYGANNPDSFITASPLIATNAILAAGILTKQAGSAVLTNWSAHATNKFVSTNLLTAKGDLAVFNGDSWTRLAKGTDEYVLTADSAQATGLKWAAGGSGTAPDFNPSQFNTNGSAQLTIKSGALLTNTLLYGDMALTGTILLWEEDADRVLVTDGDKVIQSSVVTTTELETLDGVTGGVQTNFNARIPSVNGIATNLLTVKGNLSVYTNAAVGSMIVTNAQTNLALTASRAVFTDANKALSSTAASAALSGSLSDESGSGVLVMSTGASLTNAGITLGKITNSAFWGSNNVEGSWAWSSATVATLVDGVNVIDPGDFVNVRLTQVVTADWSLAGINGGRANKTHRLFNDTDYNMIILNQSGSAAAASRFFLDGGDSVLVIPPGGMAVADYNAVVSLWNVSAITIPVITLRNNATTEDAVQTTVFSFNIPSYFNSGTISTFIFSVNAVESGIANAASYYYRAAFLNDGGSVSQIGATQAIAADLESDASWAFTVDLSGSTVRGRATGVAATDIYWYSTVTITTGQTP